MNEVKDVTDPLRVLSPELVLRVLEFTPVSTLAALSAVSKAWHGFIDVAHQDAIYVSKSTTTRQSPAGARARGRRFSPETSCFSKLFEGTSSWKDLCKRQTLLARSWADRHPAVQESVLQVGNDPVWRFRPDFKRRWFISTSQMGGLYVTDMDTGRLLWRLPSTLDHDDEEDHAVRPYAHLEYQDGIVVFDREGDAVEVWQTTDIDDSTATRGEFRRIGVLNHDCQTRGFQLNYHTLCVVSSEGQGFVYDVTQRPPTLTTRIAIEQGAVGHLDQSEDMVIYSMGPRGYHAYHKTTGAFVGALQPSHCTDRWHIPPDAPAPAHANVTLFRGMQPPHQGFPSQVPHRDCLAPVEVIEGALPPSVNNNNADRGADGDNEWGAGMLSGDLFVGFSRIGHVFVCPDWRKALGGPADLAAVSSVIECVSDGSRFHQGGWLAVHDHRLMFEIEDRIYVVGLDDRNGFRDAHRTGRPSYSFLTGFMQELCLPVSYMSICDDAIMYTYTVRSLFLPSPNRATRASGLTAETPICRLLVRANPFLMSRAPHTHSNIFPDPGPFRPKRSASSASPRTSLAMRLPCLPTPMLPPTRPERSRTPAYGIRSCIIKEMRHGARRSDYCSW